MTSEDNIQEFIDSVAGLEGLSDDDLGELYNYLLDDSSIEQKYVKEEEEEAEPEKKVDLRTEIGKMNLPKKLKVAMFGNASCRAILINNGNRLVQVAVMKNPKVQDKEIATFLKNPNISKAVLRLISGNRLWMKPYSNKISIISNPKTPIDIAIKWLRFVHKADLKKIARSKSIPGAVVTQAKKKLEVMSGK